MSDQYKLNADGNCPTCSKLSVQGEHIQCFSCNESFHAICSSASNDDKVGTKTMVTHFLLASTKNNFMFYCDKCLTEMEISKAETEERRIENLENKMIGIDKQLDEIKKLLNGTNKANASISDEKSRNYVPVIPLSESYENKAGDLVLVCESKVARNELKNLVQTADQDILMNSPNTKGPSLNCGKF